MKKMDLSKSPTCFDLAALERQFSNTSLSDSSQDASAFASSESTEASPLSAHQPSPEPTSPCGESPEPAWEPYTPTGGLSLFEQLDEKFRRHQQRHQAQSSAAHTNSDASEHVVPSFRIAH